MGLIVQLDNHIHTLEKLSTKDIILLLISVAFSILAAKMSWSCSKHYHHMFRVLFAILAFMFGENYVILFLIFRSDICGKIF